VAEDRQAHRRSIRSFVLRQGRISNAQRRAHDELLPIYGVAAGAAPLDLETLFGRSAPKILEIGFGMGETTVEIAARHPECDYLGVEVHTPGVGSLLKRLAERNLGNVRVVQQDAVEVLRDRIAPAGLDGIHIFFPDPWPKKRHHKRRLIQPSFVALLVSRLKSGAYVHACTDWEDYARQMLEVFSSEPALVNTAAGYAARPDSRPQTKFETRGLALGHPVRDLLFRKT
jgi:tRNA (guanine-N7-)-methyltransferase